MRYTTKVIQIAGENFVHYKVIQDYTICGIELDNVQMITRYTLDDIKLCEKCRERRPVPRLKDWNPRYKIENGEHAKSTITLMHLFYQSLTEEVQIGWGIWEYGNLGSNSLTNFLINDQPNIEEILEKERKLKVSYRFKNEREERMVSFDQIAEYMSLIREDYLESLQQRTN